MSAASSEEIAAALTYAFLALPHSKHREVIAAHLSRLREEAEFRDAARLYFGSFFPGGGAETKLAAVDPVFRNAIAAYRALEEPRDA